MTKSRLDAIAQRLDALELYYRQGRMTPDQVEEWQWLLSQVEEAVREWKRQRREAVGFMLAAFGSLLLLFYEVWIDAALWYWLATWAVGVYSALRFWGYICLWDREAKT